VATGLVLLVNDPAIGVQAPDITGFIGHGRPILFDLIGLDPVMDIFQQDLVHLLGEMGTN